MNPNNRTKCHIKKLPKNNDVKEKPNKLTTICRRIHKTNNFSETASYMISEIRLFFGVDAMIVYIVEGKKRELSPMFYSPNAPVSSYPLSVKSLPGFGAVNQKTITIQNVYDKEELRNLDPDVIYDPDRDNKNGFKTRQVLIAPLLCNGLLIGVLELINKASEKPFSQSDQKNIGRLCGALSTSLIFQSQHKA